MAYASSQPGSERPARPAPSASSARDRVEEVFLADGGSPGRPGNGHAAPPAPHARPPRPDAAREASEPYDLSGEGATPWHDAPAKRVRTTLGRHRPRPQDKRLGDPTAWVVSALRPGIIQGGRVRLTDALEDSPTAPRLKAEPVIRLRPLVVRESTGHRLLFAAVAFVFSVLYLGLLLAYWAPANSGIDPHGYLLGGELLAQQGTMRYVPADPFAFIGNAWIASDETVTGAAGETVQAYYPRYPAGLPLLYAAFFRFAPDAQAMQWAHLVSPVSAALAVLGMFFFARFAGGSFLGALAMLALAGSQVLLQLGDVPNSHTAALACAVWGFVLLLWWWRSEGWVKSTVLGIAAGLLVGYAFTIRYSEGLLGLPLALACLFAWNWRRPFVSAVRVIIPIVAWAIPVAGLLVYNHYTMGALFGYDTTRQTAGFGWEHIAQNWETMARQFNDTGLYFLLPVGIMGILAMCARRLRLGLVVLSWLLATVGVYTAYYWAPDQWGLAYLRFFLTAFPPVLFGAAYLMRRVLYAPSDGAYARIEGVDETGRPVVLAGERQTGPSAMWRQLASPIAAGLIVAAAVGVGTHRAVGALPDGGGSTFREGGLQLHHGQNLNTWALGRVVREQVPGGSLVFMDVPGVTDNAIHHIDLVGDYTLYDATMFTDRFARRVRGPWSGTGEDGSPNPIQQRRYEFLQALYEGMDSDELSARVRQIITRAHEQDRRVFLVMTSIDLSRFRQSHRLLGDFDLVHRATFDEWPPVGRQHLATVNQWSIVEIVPEMTQTPTTSPG